MAQPLQRCSAGAGSPIPSAEVSISPTTTSTPSSWPVGMLEAPRVLANGMEVSVHACTRGMAREVKYIFPHLKPRVVLRSGHGGANPSASAGGVKESVGWDGNGEGGHDEVLIVPTIQKSRVDTVRFGAEVEEEKDRCLEYVRGLWFVCDCGVCVGRCGRGSHQSTTPMHTARTSTARHTTHNTNPNPPQQPLSPFTYSLRTSPSPCARSCARWATGPTTSTPAPAFP